MFHTHYTGPAVNNYAASLCRQDDLNVARPRPKPMRRNARRDIVYLAQSLTYLDRSGRGSFYLLSPL